MQRIYKTVLITIAALLLAVPATVFAAFAPAGITFDSLVKGADYQRTPAATIAAEITPPTMDANNILSGFEYVWNRSADTVTEPTTSLDDISNPVIISTDTAMFSNMESGSASWYLHVRSKYLAQNGDGMVSEYTTAGPYNIDNTAPSGTLALAFADGQDPEGNTITANIVTLSLTASADIAKVYLNSEDDVANSEENVFDTELVYGGLSAEAGEKTIYAWFEDKAGNRTATPTQLTVTMLGQKTMDPFDAVRMVTEETKVFSIKNAGSETYNWSLVAADGSALSNPAPAEFSGSNTGVASVTVKAIAEGTFKVKAISTGATQNEYLSKQVSVFSFMLGDVTNDGNVDITDVLTVIDIIFGVITPTAQQFSAANIDTTNQTIDITDLLELIDIIFE